MRVLTENVDDKEINMLLQHHDKWCVSLFLPTEPGGLHGRENEIRFKNSMDSAKRELESLEGSKEKVQELINPIVNLHDDSVFWQTQRKGLAVLSSSNFFRVYLLPDSCKERVVVLNRFHTKPLLPFLYDKREFYILALSQDIIRFFKGSRYSLHEISLKGIAPTSLDEALWTYEIEKEQQFRSYRQPGRGKSRISFGVGSDADDAVHKKHIERFMQIVSNGIDKFLANRSAPLVLAGVEFLQTTYRETSSYKNIVSQGIGGNPESERISEEELRKKAWDALEPIFAEEINNLIERAGSQGNIGKDPKNLQNLILAARDGRIAQVILKKDHDKWGIFNEPQRKAEFHKERQYGDEDLFNRLAMETLNHGGRVYLVEDLPQENLFAAVLRF